MKSKKGLSAVVATLLIILITIAAVMIVWQVVKKNIKTTAGEMDKIKCGSLDLTVDTCVKGSATTPSTSSILYGAGDVEKLVITFENAAGATNITTLSGTDLPVLGAKKTVITSSNFTATKVTVTAFVLSSENTELGCGEVDSKACA